MGIGIALGGVARGLESAEQALQNQQELKLRQQTILQDADLRKQAVGVQERGLQRAEQQDLLSQADTIIGNELKVVGEVIKEGLAAGHTKEQLATAVEPILADVDRLSARVGRDSSVYRNQVGAMLTQPTAAQAAAAEGTAEAEKSKAMTAAGVSSANVMETIKLKIARGDQLTPGEERLYSDSLKQGTGGVVELLRALGVGEEASAEAPPAPTAAMPSEAPKGTFKTEADYYKAVNTGRIKVEAGDKVVIGGQLRTVIE
jgi:hypothetical protein